LEDHLIKRIPLIICFSLWILYAQNNDSVQTIDLGLTPYFSPINKLHLSFSDSLSLHLSLNKGKSVATLGNYLFFTGWGLQLIALLFDGFGNSTIGISSLTIGSAFRFSGPIISCIGGDISSKAMNTYCHGYEKHKGWKYYLLSWELYGADIAIGFLGGAIVSSTHSQPIAITTVVVGTAVGLAAIFTEAESVVKPRIYCSGLTNY